MSEQSEFLDLLYQAPAAPALWAPVMQRLADMTGGAGAWLSSINVINGAGQGLWARVDPQFPRKFFDHYAACNPLNNVPDPDGYMRNWRPRVLTDEDWISKEELRRTEFYNDFLEPLEATSVAMVRLAKHPGTASTSVVNIGRPTRKGQFQQAELQKLSALHADLIRAFNLTVAFDQARVLDLCDMQEKASPSHVVMLVDEMGYIVRCTPEGEALLRRRNGVTSSGRRLRAVDAQAAARLEGLIRRSSARPPAPAIGGQMALPSPDRATPLLLSIAPAPSSAPAVFHQERLSLVLITDPEDRPQPPQALLVEMFALTPSEARVALSLMDGGSLKDVAERLGISVNTATVHLSRVFSKVGARRQSELAALLCRIGVRLAPSWPSDPRRTEQPRER